MTGRYESLTDDLTLDEQARLAGGDDVWFSSPLPERGVPRIKVSDGPVGVRGESHTTTTSASFPCGAALGATFDLALVARVAAALAAEARTKRAHVLLGPTVNLHRHPLGGRNFECYSEDPTHTARTVVAFVRGLQGEGIAACVKHLVANDAEIERMTISSEVDERTLREVYLRPFEAAVIEAGAWSLMGSYNRLNGISACENQWLLDTVVRGEWGFDGLIMSDWYATYDSVRCGRAGLDLEMPGPAQHFGPPLADAVRRGDVPAAAVAEKARRVLRLADRVGATEGPELDEESIDDPGRWSLAREAASAAMVLLRNEVVADATILPLAIGSLRSVAVIGPNADVAMIQGGGSAQVVPHRTVTPLQGLRDRLGPDVEVTFEPGCTTGKRAPVLDGRLVRTADGRAGIDVAYRDSAGGDVLLANTIPKVEAIWYGTFARAVDPYRFHVTMSGTLTASRPGVHQLTLVSVGPAVVHLDGEVVLDTTGAGSGRSFFGFGSEEVRTEVELVPGEPHDLVVDYARGPHQMAGLRVGVRQPLGDDAIERAAAAAAAADVAVVVVGTDEEWEGEGHDRRTMSLPGEQDALVRRVVAANPRTVVVVNAGAAVDLPWADDVPALLVSWFPGMAGGEALARVLVGDDEPGGRLPMTVPVTLADAPCDISTADPPGELHYTERLEVGHRWYLGHAITPRWWFGAGRGYTTFEWGVPMVAGEVAAAGPLTVTVPLTNTGPRAGTEVVQAYVRRPASAIERPAWVLAGFAKVGVAAGAAATAEVELDPSVLRHWDTASSCWQVEPGPLAIRIARHAGDPGQVVTTTVLPTV